MICDGVCMSGKFWFLLQEWNLVYLLYPYWKLNSLFPRNLKSDWRHVTELSVSGNAKSQVNDKNNQLPSSSEKGAELFDTLYDIN